MPNIVYTLAERIDMVVQHEHGLSYRNISDHFAAANPGRPIPSISTIRNIVKRFHRTGNLDMSLVKVKQPKKTLSDEIKLDICLKAEEDKTKTNSRIARELGISVTSVRKVLRNTHYRNPRLRHSGQSVSNNMKIEFAEIEPFRLKIEPIDNLIETEPPEPDPLKLDVEPTNCELLFVKIEPFSTEP